MVRTKIVGHFQHSTRPVGPVEIDHVADLILAELSRAQRTALDRELTAAGHRGDNTAERLSHYATTELRKLGKLNTKSRRPFPREISGGAPGSRRRH
ncbi:hypothetical protein [Mycolicibacterium gilvum]|uniref:hypothetical protein n=1 Tax=Mycolicibacterium gilvum TaxID=1804 RepID=UPI004046631B